MEKTLALIDRIIGEHRLIMENVQNMEQGGSWGSGWRQLMKSSRRTLLVKKRHC